MSGVFSIDEVLAAALRGESLPWPAEQHDPLLIKGFKTRIQFHGIAALLAQQYGVLLDWPEELKAWLRNQSIGRVMWEHAHRAVLSDFLDCLHQADISCRILKGTAIAYAHYPEPAHRARGDSDVLISREHLADVRQVFGKLGFERPLATQSSFGDLHYQEVWRHIDRAGLVHDIDLHWEVTNSRALREILDVEKFMAESFPLPRLSPLARTVSLETRLVHGFVNRAMHGPFYLNEDAICDPGRLVWAHDLHLQADQLSAENWTQLAERCLDLGVAEFAHDALDFSRTMLGTEIPANFAETLRNAPRATPAARYILEQNPNRRTLYDFLATHGLWARLRFLLARLIPSPAHLRAKYNNGKRRPLLLLPVRHPFRTT